jgi:fatty acid/phospholipid biosynthesis enzyme
LGGSVAVTVVVDCMGGDHGPSVTVPAAIDYLRTAADVHIVLVGMQDAIATELRGLSAEGMPHLGVLHASEVVGMDEAPALAAANKRVGNILKKIEGVVEAKINDTLLQEPAEKALSNVLAKIKPEADALFESGDYTNSLKALAALKAPVDDFFDNVMVNADDPALKANRQGLLATLHQAMNRVADLSKLAT